MAPQHMTQHSLDKFIAADSSVDQFIEERRRRVVEAFGNVDAVVVIASGEPIGKPGGLDQTYPFLPHPNYYWLTNSRRWGNVLTWEPASGWTHFVRPVEAKERLWEGTTERVDGVDRKELDDWLKARGGRPIAMLGGPLADVTADSELSDALREALEAARRPKDRFPGAPLEPAHHTAFRQTRFRRGRNRRGLFADVPPSHHQWL